MEGSMDELNTVKREASQVCAAVQRSTSLDSMPPPSNMSTLQFLNNGSSSSNNNSSTSAKADESSNNTLLPVMVNVNNSMPPGSQPCPVQRSRSLPLLDQSPLDTDDILAELANRANTGNNVSTVGDGIDPLSVETMAQQDGSLNGADDSGSNQDLNSVGSIPHQDYSTGPSTPTTPHHIPDQSKMSIHLNHQDLSPPPHSGHMPLQPLNLSQNIDSKLFSQSLPPNLFATLRPNQGSRDYLSQQQALPSNWSSGIPDSRFTFRNTEPFATYPGLSLAGLNQGRNSPFTTSYSLLRDGDKPPQFPPDVYNSIGIPQGLHFSRSLMQLQQAPFVRGQIPRDIEPTLEETVRVVSSIAGEPVENNNILKSTANVQQAFNEAVSNSLADKYTLSGNLSMSMPETSQGSPVTVGQKSNSPALRLKPMSDHMLSMINTYSEEQLLSESGNLMSNSPVMMDESFLTSAMNSGAMSRLQEAPNLPQVDNHSPSVNNEPFNLLDGSGDVEDTNFMPHGISPPQPPLGMDQAGTTNANLLNYTSTSAAAHGDMKGHLPTGGGNNNQQLSGSSPGDGPSKPKKGRPRAGAPGHRYSQPCPTCGKVFGSSSALAKHKLIHSSERRHKCILCAKSFKRQDHLTGHMLTHRSRKPYECTVDNCNKSYCDIRSLRRHFESQHPGMVMEDNMNYTGDEKDPELMRAEAAARQAQSQPFPSSASPQQQSDYIVNYATTTSPPTSVTNQESDSSSGSSSSAALQYLAQAAQRANTSTLSTLASVAAGQNLALANNQEPPEINLQEPPSSFASDISSHFLSSGNVPQSLPVSLGSIPSGSSGLTVSIPAPRIPEASMGGPSSGYQPPGMMSSPPKKTSTGKPSKQDKERTMVKCSICSKTFKSMPALNGHMRLHGGYNSSRTSTPPTSNQDQVKRPPKSLPSQVPSTFTPSSMDFSSGAYPHHMVMPQHNVSVPPPQPSSGPNMVSFVSSRYPPPENTYRSGMLQTAQQVIGGGHPAPMGHHLLQSSQLLQAHSRQLSDYNLVRPSTLSSSYPHSGLSSLSQAAIKLEAEAKNNCQLPDTSTALNLSAPKRNVVTPSPPDLEAEVKYQCLDDSRHFMDRRIPMSSTQTSYSYQPPQGKVERDLEKDVFRDPTPVQVSPTKRKQRPPSLIIPAWATTGNPGGILPSAFQSQMRSPREIGPGFMYRTNSTTPPPYTPPPMLSPIRSGSGLYFSANSSGSNRVTTPAVPGPTPTTPSMLQFHRRTSTSGPAEETDLVFSSEPHINVGADFQAVIPELEKGPCPDDEDEREGTLMWSTETNKLYPEVEVHYFLDLACTPTLPGGARNTEFAYHCLQHAQGDIEIALMMLLNQKPLLPKNVHVNGYKYDFATPWSQSERKAFRDMYKAKGKDFHEIQKGIPTKTAKDCIEYYYFWKKLYPYNADMQKFCHHSGVTPNEEMRKQECDLFPDEVFLDYVPLKEYRSDKYGRCIEEEQKTNTTKPAASEKTTPKSDGPFLCSYPECQASFKSRQALNGHIRVHGGLYKGDKVAPKPKPRIPSASDSSEEEEEEDEDDIEEEMEEGARESTGEDASSSDEMSEDGTQNLYPCKICGKEFTKIKSRSAHMKSHRKVEEKNTPGPPLMSSETAADSQEEDPTVRPSISSMSDGDVDDYGMGWETESSSNNGQMEESMSSDAEMSD